MMSQTSAFFCFLGAAIYFGVWHKSPKAWLFMHLFLMGLFSLLTSIQ